MPILAGHRSRGICRDGRAPQASLIHGPAPAISADEKRNRERPAADLEIDTSAST